MVNHTQLGEPSETANDIQLPWLKELQPFQDMPEVPVPFVGREHEREAALARLAQTGIVAITGMLGSGKTALAAAISRTTQRHPLWLDISPGLNDSADPFLWQLAHPLAEYAPAVWHTLYEVEEADAPTTPLAKLDVILNAYSKGTTSFLICIDRINHTLDPMLETLLVAMCTYRMEHPTSQLAILFVGRTLPKTIADYALPPLLGLSQEAVTQWAQNIGLKIDEPSIQTISAQTAGLPQALAFLFATLLVNPSTVSLERIIAHREIRRFVMSILNSLSREEQDFLLELAVRTHTKDAISATEQTLLERVEKIQLVTLHPSQVIEVHRLIQDFAQYRMAPPIERRTKHKELLH